MAGLNFKLAVAALLLATVAAALLLTSCGSTEKTRLHVINAGSLMVPFWQLEEEFEALHPDVDVVIEGHGSIQVIRQVTELSAEADVLAVADYSLIPMMMYDVQMPDTNESYADWYLIFATNRLGIAYTPQSRYSDTIDSANWYQVLSRSDVRVGMSDPRFDSCGYRALMTCQLAELYYGDDSIFESVTGGFSPALTVEQSGNSLAITVPEVLRPEKVAIRGSSVALLATVQSGDLDYAFMYQSVAEQHGLQFLELPPEIDLDSDAFTNLIEGLTVELSFQRFASVNPVFDCQQILYGVTIPRNVPHPLVAEEFLAFLLGPRGQDILREQHQRPIAPAQAGDPDRIPERLKGFL